jgi:hypothetical protein
VRSPLRTGPGCSCFFRLHSIVRRIYPPSTRLDHRRCPTSYLLNYSQERLSHRSWVHFCIGRADYDLVCYAKWKSYLSSEASFVSFNVSE